MVWSKNFACSILFNSFFILFFSSACFWISIIFLANLLQSWYRRLDRDRIAPHLHTHSKFPLQEVHFLFWICCWILHCLHRTSTIFLRLWCNREFVFILFVKTCVIRFIEFAAFIEIHLIFDWMRELLTRHTPWFEIPKRIVGNW